MSECNGNWFLSCSGRKIDPWNIKPEDIHIEDIAHSLSKICRFNGHCKTFYSVAQHSLFVSHVLPEELKLNGLLHDATEAYCGDMIKPIKVNMPEYVELESRIWGEIAKKFNLPLIMDPKIKEADKRMLMTERRDLLPPEPTPWLVSEAPYDFTIRPLSPNTSETIFLYEYEMLTK